jgi:hypothetical protein
VAKSIEKERYGADEVSKEALELELIQVIFELESVEIDE